jgi:sulfite reductase (ferredoxin)
LGLVEPRILSGLADLAEHYSAEAALHLTPGQGVLIRSVRESDLPALGAAVRALDPALAAPGALGRIVACTGASTCRLGIGLSRDLARACAEALDRASFPDEILASCEIRINGCPNCCGGHPVGDIGLSGVLQRHEGRPVPSYRIHVAARRGEGRTRFAVPITIVPAEAVPGYIVALLTLYAAQRIPGESFADTFDRLGPEPYAGLGVRE